MIQLYTLYCEQEYQEIYNTFMESLNFSDLTCIEKAILHIACKMAWFVYIKLPYQSRLNCQVTPNLSLSNP